jgi:hypothetical protein
MSQTYDEAEIRPVTDILSTAVRVPRLDERGRLALARYHRAVADRSWSETARELNEDLQYEIELQRGGEETEALREAVESRRPPAAAVEPEAPETARRRAIGRFAAGCSGHVTRPPYTTGDPLSEEVGTDAIVVRDEVAPTVMGRMLPSVDDLKTFSQLSVPSEGALSLAVGLGRLPVVGGGFSLHPPAEEYPQTWPLPGGTLEVTTAKAMLGYAFACLPGAPLDETMVVDVTVDIRVGDRAKPFYLVRPARPPDAPIVQAFGVGHLLVATSDNTQAAAEVRFLEHREGALQVFGTPIVRRELAVSRRLTLQPGTNWIYVSLEVRLEVHRWWILAPPPERERRGFAGIDLRSPEQRTYPIHQVLDRAGPVMVPRISLTLCPERFRLEDEGFRVPPT